MGFLFLAVSQAVCGVPGERCFLSLPLWTGYGTASRYLPHVCEGAETKHFTLALDFFTLTSPEARSYRKGPAACLPNV